MPKLPLNLVSLTVLKGGEDTFYLQNGSVKAREAVMEVRGGGRDEWMRGRGREELVKVGEQGVEELRGSPTVGLGAFCAVALLLTHLSVTSCHGSPVRHC